jgi:predicted phage-related endonuclease
MKKGLIQYKTASLSELEWQDLRSTFSAKGMVGGSDSGTLLGWNKWRSPISMFYQAIGQNLLPTKMNRQMAFGKMLEDSIANMWQYWDGEEAFIQNIITKTKVRKFRKVKSIIVNPDYPFLFANIDGMVTHHPVKGKKKGILEIKNIGKMTVDSYMDGIPPSYIAQMNHYMLVTGLSYAEICMQVDGQNMLVKLFEADREIQKAIIDKSIEHQTRVRQALDAIREAGVDDQESIFAIAALYEPDADDSEDFNAFMSVKHRARENDIEIVGDIDLQEKAKGYIAANEKIKEGENLKLHYGNQLKQHMEKHGAQIMNLPDGKITWRRNFLIKLNS